MENLDDTIAAAWDARKPILRPMLEGTKADILLLQEINSVDAPNELCQGTHYANHSTVSLILITVNDSRIFYLSAP